MFNQTYLNLLEGAVNHGDEHVEQHYHHGNVVHPVQHIADVLDELVVVVDHYRPDLGQSKYGPEQRLEALLQAGWRQQEDNVNHLTVVTLQMLPAAPEPFYTQFVPLLGNMEY